MSTSWKGAVVFGRLSPGKRPVTLLVLSFLIMSTGNGCGSKIYDHGLLADPTQDASVELYVFRVSTHTNAAVRTKVSLDDAPLFKLRSGTYAKVYFRAGAHELQIEDHSFVREFHANRTYFYLIEPLGYIEAEGVGWTVTEVGQSTADSLKPQLNPLGAVASNPQLYRNELDDSMAPTDRALWIIQDLESAEQGLTASEVPAEEVVEIHRELTDRVRTHPEDVASCVLLARLIRVRTSMQAWAQDPASPTPTSLDSVEAELRVAHRVLESSLERAPDNAALHYWQARLYGLRVPVASDDGLTFEALSQVDAIESAEKAVQYDPSNQRNRELLSLYLVDAGRLEEALTLTAEMADGQLALHFLIRDLQATPVPLPSMGSDWDVRKVTAQQRSQGHVLQYPELRVRFYLVPMSSSEVAAFYGELWPGFQLFELDRTTTYGGGEIRFHGQVVTREQGSFVPTGSEKLVGTPDAVEGVSISVNEYTNVTGIRTTPGGFPIPDSLAIYCFLTLINHSHSDAMADRGGSQ